MAFTDSQSNERVLEMLLCHYTTKALSLCELVKQRPSRTPFAPARRSMMCFDTGKAMLNSIKLTTTAKNSRT